LLKRTNPPEAARDRLSSEGSQETEAVRLTRELRDALKQLTTTAEILEVIRNSLDDTQLVFDAIVLDVPWFLQQRADEVI
jgi:hypothetical protein